MFRSGTFCVIWRISGRFSKSRSTTILDADFMPFMRSCNLKSRRCQLEAFNPFNALRLRENISQSIQFENRRPQGTVSRFGLLLAITNHLWVRFTYEKLWEAEPSQRLVGALALKSLKTAGTLFQQNWIRTLLTELLRHAGWIGYPHWRLP